jgi:hypothetical protein
MGLFTIAGLSGLNQHYNRLEKYILLILQIVYYLLGDNY